MILCVVSDLYLEFRFRSANIFGGAKPIDTTAREREMEEKIAANKEKLMYVCELISNAIS